MAKTPVMPQPEPCGYAPSPEGLASLRFIRALHEWRTVDSTNARAMALGRAGLLQPGTLLLAGCQTAGRGRLGHSWHSETDAGIYATLFLRPGQFPGREQEALASGWLTLAAGVAIHEAVAGFLPGHLRAGLDLKWPNDILFGGRKLCGILAEAEAGAEGVRFAVLGFGVNVHHRGFPGEISDSAISLHAVLSAEPDRRSVLAAILETLDRRLDQVSRGLTETLRKDWESRSSFARGREVAQWVGGRNVLQGVTDGLCPDGALRVREENGTIHAVRGGEVVDWHRR